MSFQHLCSSLVALSLFPGWTPGLAQQPEWPQWRGPTGDGHAAADARPPLEWSEASNIRYKAPLPGLGHSSPIVCGDRIFLTSAIDLEAAPDPATAPAQTDPPNADHEHQYIVFALDRETGEEVWRTVVGESKPHEAGHVTGSHASASIHCDGRYLVAFFGSRGLHVLDLEGDLLWSKQLGEMKTLAGFGEGASPILYGDTVIVPWDEEGPSFVAGLDVATGEERWRQPRSSDSSWGSPVVTVQAGKPQVILTGSDTTCAYDVATGAPVWQLAGMSKNPVTSPVVADDTLYVMNSYKGKIVQALPLEGASGDLDPEQALLWSWTRDAAYVPNPLVHDGRLYYLLDSQGLLNCLDARTGEPLYTRARLEGARTIHASPVLAADRLYFTSREGVTIVTRPGDAFEVLAVNRLEDMFDATPAFVGEQVYLRGHTSLYCIAEPD